MSHHHHHHDTENEIPFNEKMNKLLQHWIKHNIDHAETYRSWKQKADSKDLGEVAGLLEEAAVMTTQINEKLEKAILSIS